MESIALWLIGIPIPIILLKIFGVFQESLGCPAAGMAMLHAGRPRPSSVRGPAEACIGVS